MDFDIATGAADPSDWKRQRAPPGTSVAGEVLKKKFQLRNNAIPPPTLQNMHHTDTSSFDMQCERDDDSDDDSHYTTNVSRSSRSSETVRSSITKHSLFPTPSKMAEGFSASLSASEMKAELDELLGEYPHLQPYLKYKIPLERKGHGDYRLPHCSIFYESACETCLDHGDICTFDGKDSSSKCIACVKFGGRCIFRNLEGSTPSQQETHFLCGRCTIGFKKDQRTTKMGPQNLPFSPAEYLSMKKTSVPTKNKIQSQVELSKRLHLTNPQANSAVPSSNSKSSDPQEQDQSSDRRRAKDANKSHVNLAQTPVDSTEGSSTGSRATALTLRSRFLSRRNKNKKISCPENSPTQKRPEPTTDSRRTVAIIPCDSRERVRRSSDVELLKNQHQPTSYHGPEISIHESFNRYPDTSILPSPKPLSTYNDTTSRTSHQETSHTPSNSMMHTPGTYSRYPGYLSNRPHNRRLFQPHGSSQTETAETEASTSDEEDPDRSSVPSHAWQRNRARTTASQALIVPPSGPKSENEIILDLVRDIAQKIYIKESEDGLQAITIDQGMREAFDIREARKQLREGFEEAQGGELIFRRLQSSVEAEKAAELEEINESAAYWKRQMKAELRSFEGKFWDYHGCKHRK